MIVFIFIFVHTRETNIHAKVKLYEMSTPCWRWLVAQFSINRTYNYWIWRPSLALNPSKKYQIINESVHIYLCTCMRNKYPCKSKIVWNVQVVLKVHDQFPNSQHARACWDMVARAIVFEIPRMTVKCTLSVNKWIDNLSSVLDTDGVKQKTSLIFVQGKSAWYCFMIFFSFVFVICVRYTK